jgi:hypothetical protein
MVLYFGTILLKIRADFSVWMETNLKWLQFIRID